MDTDKISIASDFIVIPDSIVNGDESDIVAVPMSASFFRSEHSEVDLRQSTNPNFDKIKFTSILKVGIDPSWSAPLSVTFNTADEFTINSSDRVALYKVGFSSSKDFLCFKWAPQPSTDDVPIPYTVLFEANILPRDTEEEFYQICYLMKNGRIAGVSDPFQLKVAENLPVHNEIENAARNVLSIRIRELLKENESLKEEINQVQISEGQNLDLLIIDFIEEKAKIEKLIQKNELLIRVLAEKEKEIEEKRAVARNMQERLTATVVNMDEMKETLSKCEEGKSISQERQQVLVQDNEDLKQTLSIVKEELETAMKEKLAAEKIASDMSERLQATNAESQMLMLTNSRLVKKVKQLRCVVSMMEDCGSDDWLCINGVSVDKNEEQVDDNEECVDKETDEGAAERAISACMTSSAAPTIASNCTSSSSSQQQLQETVSSVKKNLEAIVTQLNKQTEEMRAIKRAVSRKNRDSSGATFAEYAGKQNGAELQNTENLSTASLTSNSSSSTLSSDKIMYDKSFLPADRTAPVFLPSKGTTPPPPALEKSPPVLPKGSGSLPPPQPSQGTAPSAPSLASMTQESESSLPAPLCPETTPSAKNAAVLKQFMDAALDGVQQGESLLPQTAVSQDEPALASAVRQEPQSQTAVSQNQPALAPDVRQEPQPKPSVRQLLRPRELGELVIQAALSSQTAVTQGQQPQAATQTPQDSDDFHSTGNNGESSAPHPRMGGDSRGGGRDDWGRGGGRLSLKKNQPGGNLRKPRCDVEKLPPFEKISYHEHSIKMKQKQMLGERLYPLIRDIYPAFACKITGMLLEIDNSYLLRMLEDRGSLNAKVEEAVAVLQAHQAKQSMYA